MSKISLLLAVIATCSLLRAHCRHLGKPSYSPQIYNPYANYGYGNHHYQIPSYYEPGAYFDQRREVMRKFPGGGVPILIDYKKRCSNHYVGLKPHPDERQYYYVCKPDSVIFGRCQRFEQFNATLGQCVQNTPSEYEPVCKALGRFPIYSDCHLYYKCEKSMKPQIYSCPHNMIFSQETSKCEPGNRCIPTQIVADAESIPEYCENKYPPCLQNGAFRSPSDCSLYYTCELQEHGVYYQTRFKCPGDTFYDLQSNACLPQEQVPCDCITLAELVYPRTHIRQYAPISSYPPMHPFIQPGEFDIDSLEENDNPIEKSEEEEEEDINSNSEDSSSSSLEDESSTGTTNQYTSISSKEPQVTESTTMSTEFPTSPITEHTSLATEQPPSPLTDAPTLPTEQPPSPLTDAPTLPTEQPPSASTDAPTLPTEQPPSASTDPPTLPTEQPPSASTDPPTLPTEQPPSGITEPEPTKEISEADEESLINLAVGPTTEDYDDEDDIQVLGSDADIGDDFVLSNDRKLGKGPRTPNGGSNQGSDGTKDDFDYADGLGPALSLTITPEPTTVVKDPEVVTKPVEVTATEVVTEPEEATATEEVTESEELTESKEQTESEEQTDTEEVTESENETSTTTSDSDIDENENPVTRPAPEDNNDSSEENDGDSLEVNNDVTKSPEGNDTGSSSVITENPTSADKDVTVKPCDDIPTDTKSNHHNTKQHCSPRTHKPNNQVNTQTTTEETTRESRSSAPLATTNNANTDKNTATPQNTVIDTTTPLPNSRNTQLPTPIATNTPKTTLALGDSTVDWIKDFELNSNWEEKHSEPPIEGVFLPVAGGKQATKTEIKDPEVRKNTKLSGTEKKELEFIEQEFLPVSLKTHKSKPVTEDLISKKEEETTQPSNIGSVVDQLRTDNTKEAKTTQVIIEDTTKDSSLTSIQGAKGTTHSNATDTSSSSAILGDDIDLNVPNLTGQPETGTSVPSSDEFDSTDNPVDNIDFMDILGDSIDLNGDQVTHPIAEQREASTSTPSFGVARAQQIDSEDFSDILGDDIDLDAGGPSDPNFTGQPGIADLNSNDTTDTPNHDLDFSDILSDGIDLDDGPSDPNSTGQPETSTSALSSSKVIADSTSKDSANIPVEESASRDIPIDDSDSTKILSDAIDLDGDLTVLSDKPVVAPPIAEQHETSSSAPSFGATTAHSDTEDSSDILGDDIDLDDGAPPDFNSNDSTDTPEHDMDSSEILSEGIDLDDGPSDPNSTGQAETSTSALSSSKVKADSNSKDSTNIPVEDSDSTDIPIDDSDSTNILGDAIDLDGDLSVLSDKPDVRPLTAEQRETSASAPSSGVTKAHSDSEDSSDILGDDIDLDDGGPSAPNFAGQPGIADLSSTDTADHDMDSTDILGDGIDLDHGPSDPNFTGQPGIDDFNSKESTDTPDHDMDSSGVLSDGIDLDDIRSDFSFTEEPEKSISAPPSSKITVDSTDIPADEIDSTNIPIDDSDSTDILGDAIDLDGDLSDLSDKPDVRPATAEQRETSTSAPSPGAAADNSDSEDSSDILGDDIDLDAGGPSDSNFTGQPGIADLNSKDSTDTPDHDIDSPDILSEGIDMDDISSDGDLTGKPEKSSSAPSTSKITAHSTDIPGDETDSTDTPIDDSDFMDILADAIDLDGDLSVLSDKPDVTSPIAEQRETSTSASPLPKPTSHSNSKDSVDILGDDIDLDDSTSDLSDFLHVDPNSIGRTEIGATTDSNSQDSTDIPGDDIDSSAVLGDGRDLDDGISVSSDNQDATPPIKEQREISTKATAQSISKDSVDILGDDIDLNDGSSDLFIGKLDTHTESAIAELKSEDSTDIPDNDSDFMEILSDGIDFDDGSADSDDTSVLSDGINISEEAVTNIPQSDKSSSSSTQSNSKDSSALLDIDSNETSVLSDDINISDEGVTSIPQSDVGSPPISNTSDQKSNLQQNPSSTESSVSTTESNQSLSPVNIDKPNDSPSKLEDNIDANDNTSVLSDDINLPVKFAEQAETTPVQNLPPRVPSAEIEKPAKSSSGLREPDTATPESPMSLPDHITPLVEPSSSIPSSGVIGDPDYDEEPGTANLNSSIPNVGGSTERILSSTEPSTAAVKTLPSSRISGDSDYDEGPETTTQPSKNTIHPPTLPDISKPSIPTTDGDKFTHSPGDINDGASNSNENQAEQDDDSTSVLSDYIDIPHIPEQAIPAKGDDKSTDSHSHIDKNPTNTLEDPNDQDDDDDTSFVLSDYINIPTPSHNSIPATITPPGMKENITTTTPGNSPPITQSSSTLATTSPTPTPKYIPTSNITNVHEFTVHFRQEPCTNNTGVSNTTTALKDATEQKTILISVPNLDINKPVNNANSNNTVPPPPCEPEKASMPRLEIFVEQPMDVRFVICPKTCAKDHKHKYADVNSRAVKLKWYPNKSRQTMALETSNKIKVDA